MKRLKAGPELKMPELKVPPFLIDLYWDLRDRRLLPLVVLIIVAIVAAPILLSGGSSESPSTPPAEIAAVANEAVGSEASSLTVVEAKPGLREYSKRLAHRRPADPFQQRYTSTPPTSGGSELGPETSTSTSSSTSASSSTETTATSLPPSNSSPEPAPSESPSDKEAGGGDATQKHLTLFAFAIDVKIVRIEGGEGNSQSNSDSSTRNRVMPTTPLPGEKAPVVTYMGVGKGAKNALLMISNNVKSIYGDAKCLSGTDTCQLLEVEPGLPETFVYGDNDIRYKITVLKIEPVAAGKG